MTAAFSANVVVEAQLPDRLAKGAAIAVTCTAAPLRKHTGYYGQWTVRVILGSGEARQLVTQRAPSEARIIKTLTGVATLLSDAGCETLNVPFREGVTAINDGKTAT